MVGGQDQARVRTKPLESCAPIYIYIYINVVLKPILIFMIFGMFDPSYNVIHPKFTSFFDGLSICNTIRISLICIALDGSELARLAVGCDVGVAALRAMISDALQMSLGKLRIILPDGTCLGEDSANTSLAVLLS